MTDAPYGTWKSPISAESVCGESIGFPALSVDRATGRVFHLESRPPTGVHVLVESENGVDVTPLALQMLGSGPNVGAGAAATLALESTNSKSSS